MIVEKQLLLKIFVDESLEMIMDESLEMIVDESLEMIEDESLEMIVDEPLMVEDKSLKKPVDEDEEHFESVIADMSTSVTDEGFGHSETAEKFLQKGDYYSGIISW
ncbi:hypothetical protein Tco_1329920 [Tanacetum coccineum]